jgi:hypothetical protein
MIKKFTSFNKLNESPDSIFFNNKKSTYKSDDAVPFSIFKNLKTDEYFLYVHNKKGVTHYEMQYVPYGNEKMPKYEKIWSIFYGRLWLDSKVIAFWKIPLKNRIEGKNILDIEQYYKEKIPTNKENDIDVFNYYMKDLKNKLVKRGFISKNEDMGEWYIETTNELDFIKVKDFTGDFTPNEDELKYHLMKSEDERRKFRTKKYFGNVDDSKPLKFKQALLKSEKLINESIVDEESLINKIKDIINEISNDAYDDDDNELLNIDDCPFYTEINILYQQEYIEELYWDYEWSENLTIGEFRRVYKKLISEAEKTIIKQLEDNPKLYDEYKDYIYIDVPDWIVQQNKYNI